MTLERLGRAKHPTLGDCVKIGCMIDRRREVVLFPVDQRSRTMHPKHPTGYDPNTLERAGSYAPSLSFYSELCRYAQFRWPKPGVQSS